MKIISNYLGREEREKVEKEKGKRSRKRERKNKGKKARECHPPRAGSSVASVTISAKAEGRSSREILRTREKVEAKTQPVYESVFFRS